MTGLIVRAARKSDHRFIVRSWIGTLASWQTEARGNRQMTDDAIRILGRPDTVANIVSPAHDDDTILAFMVRSPNTLFCVYVRPAWRGRGLARKLEPSLTRPKLSQWIRSVDAVMKDGWMMCVGLDASGSKPKGNGVYNDSTIKATA